MRKTVLDLGSTSLLYFSSIFFSLCIFSLIQTFINSTVPKIIQVGMDIQVGISNNFEVVTLNNRVQSLILQLLQ